MTVNTEGTEVLFEPFQLGTITLKNRFVMAPMTRRHSPEGVPGEDMAEYYARRAAGGVGLIVTEGTYIPHPASGVDTTIPRLYGEASLDGWRRVTTRVHEEGGTIFAQLWHVGVARGPEAPLNPGVPAATPSGINHEEEPVGAVLSTAEIAEVVTAFAEAAANAKDVGFDGVEIHGAHGYLIDSFLWKETNRRSDEYGGTIEGRTRLATEVVAAVRAAVGADYPVVFRFSQWKEQAWTARVAQSPRELEAILRPIYDAGLDAFHVSTRRYWLPAFVELSAEDGLRTVAGWVKKVTGAPVITVGSVGLDNEFDARATTEATSASLQPLIERFDAGEFDLVAIGRSLLADPDWVNKLRDHRADEWIGFTPEHRNKLS